MKWKPNIKKILLFLGIFLFFLIWNLIFVEITNDEVWNYGFSHSIYKGLIPYKDFNMILTPFYPWLMSLGFHLFSSSMLVFHIENAIVLTIFCFLLFHLLKEKAWFVYPLFFFPLPMTLPNYNLFLLFLFSLLLYLEKEDKNDYLIGFVVGLSFLTKQSVGFCLLLPTLFYYRKNPKKIGKRILGFSLPVLCFFIYLVVSQSLFEFLDLCVFGLFDFSKENGKKFDIWYLLVFLIILGCFVLIKKNPKKIENVYALAFCSIAVPLFDFNHWQHAFFAFMIVWLLNRTKKIPLRPILFGGGMIGIILLINIFGMCNQTMVYPNQLSHFEYRYLDKSVVTVIEKVNTYLVKNKEKKIVFLNGNAYYFKLINEIPVDYFDLINYGNWGYNGSQKLLEKIKKMNGVIFIIAKWDLREETQVDKRAVRYVIKHGKHLKKIDLFDVYMLGE